MNWGSKSKDFSLLNHMENNHRIIIFIADYYKDRTKKEKKGKHVEVTEFNNFFSASVIPFVFCNQTFNT